MQNQSNISRRIRQAGLMLALAIGIVAANASPAGAYTPTAFSGSVGARDAMQVPYPNQCGSKNFHSGQFTTTMVWVDRAPDPRYANSEQYIGAWVTLTKYNNTTGTWLPVKINGSTTTLLGWQVTEPLKVGSVTSTLTSAQFVPQSFLGLTPGWYRVEFQYNWWVAGVGYIGYVKDVFNNDTYIRLTGVSINGSSSVIKTVGSCYLD
jgi:hypothetical protein